MTPMFAERKTWEQINSKAKEERNVVRNQRKMEDVERETAERAERLHTPHS